MSKYFICVGAQKCGTTSLFDIVSKSDFANTTRIKETKFFLQDHGRENYLKLYENTDQDVFFEVDPDYLLYPETAIANIKRTFSNVDDVVIIILLRNPVDRAFSHYLMTKRRGLEDLTFEESIEVEAERVSKNDNFKRIYSYSRRGMYFDAVKDFKEAFAHVEVRLFEDCVVDGWPETIGRILKKYVDFSGQIVQQNVQVNKAGSYRFKFLAQILHTEDNIVKKVLKSLFPVQFRKRIFKKVDMMNKTDNAPETISNPKPVFYRYFEKDVSQLESLLGITLDRWRKF